MTAATMFHHRHTTQDNFQMCFDNLNVEYKFSKQQPSAQNKMPAIPHRKMATLGPKKTPETPYMYKILAILAGGVATANNLAQKNVTSSKQRPLSYVMPSTLSARS